MTRHRPSVRSRVCAALGLALLATLSTVAVGPSAASAASAKQAARHCAIVIEKLQPGDHESRVVSRECADDAGKLRMARAATLLMTWYKDLWYEGESTKVYGQDGPCDANGYGISNVGAGAAHWNDSISSYKVFNNCIWSRSYTNINYGGSCLQSLYNVDWVGLHNDQISSFLLNSVREPC